MMIPIRMDHVSQLEHMHTIIFFYFSPIRFFIRKKENKRKEKIMMEPKRTNGVSVKRVASELERKPPVLFCLIICYLFFRGKKKKEPRVVHIERERDFDAPMDTEEKIHRRRVPSKLPPWAYISKPQTFSIAKWNADAVHEGKMWKKKPRKKSWYASSDSQREKDKSWRRRSFFFFLCIQIWTLFFSVA